MESVIFMSNIQSLQQFNDFLIGFICSPIVLFLAFIMVFLFLLNIVFHFLNSFLDGGGSYSSEKPVVLSEVQQFELSLINQKKLEKDWFKK